MLKRTLAFIFLLVVLAHSKEVRLTCQTSATSECASGYKFSMTGDSLDTKYCLPVGSSCDVKYDNTLKTMTCIRDYKNDICPTEICYFMVNTPVCSKQFTCTNSPDFYQYLCTGCAYINGCPRCVNSMKNGIINAMQACLGNYCSVKDVNTTVTKCANNVDGLGFGCSCCASTNQNVTHCTSNNAALSMPEFIIWATGNTTDDNSTQFESNIQYLLLAILSIIALIF